MNLDLNRKPNISEPNPCFKHHNEPSESQKDDIAHVLHRINAVLKTAGYKKTF